jgi:hypothetical protein
MPEKMTKQEAKIEQTIRVLRKTKELLMEEDINTLPYDGLGETTKVKEPKANKADKITNETQDKEGFGLAGEENVGKSKSLFKNLDDIDTIVNETLLEAQGHVEKALKILEEGNEELDYQKQQWRNKQYGEGKYMQRGDSDEKKKPYREKNRKYSQLREIAKLAKQLDDAIDKAFIQG